MAGNPSRRRNSKLKRLVLYSWLGMTKSYGRKPREKIRPKSEMPGRKAQIYQIGLNTKPGNCGITQKTPICQTVSVKVLIVSWLRQGIVKGHAHLVPEFAYIGPPSPES